MLNLAEGFGDAWFVNGFVKNCCRKRSLSVIFCPAPSGYNLSLHHSFRWILVIYLHYCWKYSSYRIWGNQAGGQTWVRFSWNSKFSNNCHKWYPNRNPFSVVNMLPVLMQTAASCILCHIAGDINIRILNESRDPWFAKNCICIALDTLVVLKTGLTAWSHRSSVI